MKLFDYSPLVKQLKDNELNGFAEALPALLKSGFDKRRYGDLQGWEDVVSDLPLKEVAGICLDQPVVQVDFSEQEAGLKDQLFKLHPWRKGPFQLGDVFIDTEWRSDIKWNRLKDNIQSLEGRRVLDVGCGSGYHCWRMRGAGAELVVGIDPTPLFVMQFWALQKYIKDSQVWVVPARLEHLPRNLAAFDTVFSMGVLYHRRSPLEHLMELKESLRSKGQLVLETLVVDGDERQCLVPEDRYSRMGNVWFLPSVAMLVLWLRKLKFVDVEVLDVSNTTSDEQRKTEWMQFHSLDNFLDENDSTKTVEGYPAPKRAIITCKVR